MALPVSVQVCTLNEESNIGACLDSILANDPEDVVVVDGGSSDGTTRIALERGVRVIEAGPIGLAAQRREGVMTSHSQYTAFVDADDRLEPNWLETMISDLESGGYAALQSLLRVPPSGSWWSQAWDRYFRSAIAPCPDVIMVGRPALFKTSALLALPQTSGMVIEDTEMSQHFVLLGLRMGIGSAISWRLCPTQIGENFAKWSGYGRGYRQFVHQFPERRKAIAKHILYTVPVGRTMPSVLRGHLSQPLFGVMMSANMVRGWILESCKRP